MGLLDGKVAIVTGSGRGIGRAAAELFAEHGARVVVNDVDAGAAREAAEAIGKRGGDVLQCAGSVTEAAFPERLIASTLERFGALDILVNNAGYTWDGVIHKMSDEQFDAMLEVHLKAPFRILRAAAGFLRESAKAELEAGRRPPCRKIIHISSTSGVAGNAGQINYAAGKMGVVGITKTLAKEWGRYNICCNAVAYGYIDTRLTQAKESGEKTASGVALGIPQAQRDELARLVPLGRAGSVQEAAGAILFLASPLSDYVTGAVLLVTGGLYM